MNLPRVIMLGLLIGLVLNILGGIGNGVLLRDAWARAIPERPPEAIGGWLGLLLSLLSDFVFGPVLVWLYAAIQPRFGATFATAMRAALIVWVLGVAIPYIGIVRIGWLPAGLAASTSAVALAMFVPAAWMARRFYREAAAPPGRAG